MARSIPSTWSSRAIAAYRAAAWVALLSVLAPNPKLQAESQRHPIPERIQPRGTVSCTLHLSRGTQNGTAAEKSKVTLLKIPDLASLHLQETPTSIRLYWQWQGAAGAPQYQPQWAELPGPDRYFLQFTWDAEGGVFDYYVNGCPTRLPGTRCAPWKFARNATVMFTDDGPDRVADLKAEPVYLTPKAALARVPDELRFRHGKVFGRDPEVEPMAIEDRRGRLLCEAPLREDGDVRGWVSEGPARITFRDGWMQMASTKPDATGDENGHIVFWCPQEFPASFVAEWEIALVSELGLTIVFFAAKGEKGEDIFDPSLPKRDGTFAHYTRGAITSYHVSYYANTPGFLGRATSNLRKNNHFHLLASGPVAILPGSKRIHRVLLIKDDAHIQLQVDGKVSIDFTDPGGSRYGPAHRGGKIGLRQMQWTVARYRGFRVWELRSDREGSL